MKMLKEATDINHFDVLVKNLQTTMSTMAQLMDDGVVPTGAQLKSLWESSERLAEVYGKAEGVRRSQRKR